MIPSPLSSVRPTQPFHRFTVDEYERMIALGILTEDHPVVLIRGELVVDRETWASPYRFTMDEYLRMIKHGILTENDRVEIGSGNAVKRIPTSARHCASVRRINLHVYRRLEDRVTIGFHDPIRLFDSEPEPDVSVAKFREDFYSSGTPRANDLLLVIEVGDSSLTHDRDVKGPLYAESRIPEYWIVNLPDDCLEVYRSPQPDGTYADKQVLLRDSKSKSRRSPASRSKLPICFSCFALGAYPQTLDLHGAVLTDSRQKRLP